MHPFRDRVAVLGFPDSCQRYHAHAPAPWSPAALERLRGLGFGAVQLNLAWGARPDDEVLNLEDVVEAPAGSSPQPAELNCRPGAAARAHRRSTLHERIGLARAAGLRTVFHFGAPYNRHIAYGDTPPNCLSDPALAERYVGLIGAFAADFPGVDDLLVYTYDQDAWLCGEFGACPRCNGVPLHQRLVPFLDRLRATWRAINPAGTLWWEPWELSAGQVHACVEQLPTGGMGLSLHANIAECMAAVVADPWLERTCRQAAGRGLPVWVEWFLGGLSEEIEPLACLQHPLTVWRGLHKLARLPGVVGLKEYYGLLPQRTDDANLAATALFLRQPELDGATALARLAEPFGAAAAAVAEAWELASEAMERHPWDCSWLGRQIGRAATDHALSAAILRPMLCSTPSWESTRGTVFMRTEDTPAHPWMLEDVGLRCQQAVDLAERAVQAIARALPLAPPGRQAGLSAWQADLTRFLRRSRAYACHLRATCLAIALRRRLADGQALPAERLAELAAVLRESQANHAAACREEARPAGWPEAEQAEADLGRDPLAFLGRWLQPAMDARSKGGFSLTSA